MQILGTADAQNWALTQAQCTDFLPSACHPSSRVFQEQQQAQAVSPMGRIWAAERREDTGRVVMVLLDTRRPDAERTCVIP